MRAILVAVLVLLTTKMAAAVDPNECKLQRAQYPSNWNDVAKDTAAVRLSVSLRRGLAN